MEYIVVNNDKIKKYNVNFDKEVIINLKSKIIDECCEVKHETFLDTYYPFAKTYDDCEYRNVKSLNNYHNSINNYVYNYEYDKYIYPYLVKIINRLLQGDKSSIEDLFKYKGLYDYYIKDIDDMINKFIDELSDDEYDIDTKINKIELLKGLYVSKKAMVLNDKIKTYYDELQQLISFELIDEIELGDYQKINNMLDINYSFNEDVYKYKR